MIYELYELIYEEIKIVDAAFVLLKKKSMIIIRSSKLRRDKPEVDKVLEYFVLSKVDYERISIEEIFAHGFNG